MSPADSPQTFSFAAARLSAPSLHALLGNLNEFRLEVDADGEATLLGEGYRDDAAYAFTRLIYDWSAHTTLGYSLPLAAGTYTLHWQKDVPVIFVTGSPVPLPDGPAEVFLEMVLEEE